MQKGLNQKQRVFALADGQAVGGGLYGNGSGVMYEGKLDCPIHVDDLRRCHIERSNFEGCVASGLICFNNSEDGE